MRTNLHLLLVLLIACAMTGCKSTGVTPSNPCCNVLRGVAVGFAEDEDELEAKEKAWAHAIEQIQSTGTHQFHITSFKYLSKTYTDGHWLIEIFVEYQVFRPGYAEASDPSSESSLGEK